MAFKHTLALLVIGLALPAQAAEFREIDDWRGHGWRHHSGAGMPSPFNVEAFRSYWNAQARCHFDPQWGGLWCPYPLQ